MTASPVRRWIVGAAVLAAVGALGLPAASAQDPAPPPLLPCPASVDTQLEGWVCTNYIFGAGRSPSEAEVAFWVGRAESRGVATVAEDLIFSVEQSELWVAGLYDVLLGRPADPGGLTFHTALFRAARSELIVERSIILSDEFLDQFDNTEGFVGFLYQYYFGRDGDPEGLAFWTARLQQPGSSFRDAVIAFQRSPEAGDLIAQVAYLSVLGRAPDPGGLAHWTSVGQVGGLARIIVGMVPTPEAVASLGDLGICLADPECAAQVDTVIPPEAAAAATGGGYSKR